MSEQRTDLVIHAKARGLDALAKLSRTLDDQTKGFDRITKRAQVSKESVLAYRRTMEGLDQKLQTAARAQLELVKAMGAIDKASDGYRSLSQILDKLKEQEQGLAREVSLTRQAFRDQAAEADRMQQRRGSFTQGLLQGALPQAAYLQRGPGMFRQAFGVAAGSSARGVLGGLASTPWSGAQGITSALQAIPVVGGALAAPLQKAMSDATTAIQAQQTRLTSAPYLTGRSLLEQTARARNAAFARGPGEASIDAVARIARMKASLGPLPRTEAGAYRFPEGYEIAPDERMPLRGVKGGFSLTAAGQRRLREAVGAEAEAKVRGRLESEREARGARAAGAVLRQGFTNPYRQAGVELGGMSEQEVLQFAQQVSQRGGGRGDELRQGFIRSALAAQTGLGIGADVSGAFLQAGRRGGLAGGAQAPGPALTSTIADAMRLGLEGSELNDYMSQVAEGINQWRTTGIPFNRETVATLSSSFAQSVGGLRGSAVGQGLVAGVQGVAANGPQSGLGVLALQQVGGFRGGGITDYVKAITRMESGGDEASLQAFVRSIIQAGTGGATGASAEATGAVTLRRALGEFGTRVSMSEASRITSSALRGEAFTGADIQTLKGVTQGPKTPADLESLARNVLDNLGPAIKQQAALTNRQIDTGSKLITTLNNMDNAVQSTANAIAALGKEPLEKFSNAVKDATSSFDKLARQLQSPQGAVNLLFGGE